MKKTLLLALAVAAALPAAASAHVTANPTEATADGFTMIDFRVPHGCEESDTTSLTVRIPQGVVGVAPEAVPGWEVTTKSGTFDEPVEYFGETLTEGTVEVTWTGGPLSHTQFVDFGISMKMPNTPGETLWFPAIQRCEQGETRWVKIPVEGQEEPDTPAPGVTLVAAEGADEAVAAPEADEDDDDRTNAALALGAAGLVAGLAALGVALFRRPRSA
jgi:periplasmic copper chaperone A